MAEFPIYRVANLATVSAPPIDLPAALDTFQTAANALLTALGYADPSTHVSAPTLEAALAECCAQFTPPPLRISDLIAEGVEVELRSLGAAYELAKEQAHTSYQTAWETMAAAWEKGGVSA